MPPGGNQGKVAPTNASVYPRLPLRQTEPIRLKSKPTRFRAYGTITTLKGGVKVNCVRGNAGLRLFITAPRE
jgi:hypothetical protein